MLINELAQSLGLEEKELRQVIKDLNLPVSPNAKDVPDKYVDEINEYLGEDVLKEEDLIENENDVSDEIFEAKEEDKETNFGSAEEEKIMRMAEDEEIQEIRMSRVKKETRREAQARLAKQESERLKKEKEKEKELSEMRNQLGKKIVVPETISIKELAEKLLVPSSKLIAILLKNKIFVTINHKIDFETASIVAAEFDKELKKEETKISSEDLMAGNLESLLKDDNLSESLATRPPIVTIMGHVDHGKTSILDYIRKTQIAEGESGGITQHIGAYQTDLEGKVITFLDTPGHEAFAAMRARGAKVTDVAILVVAADDGVKPQTEEAIAHIKESGVKMIVALNKVDKEGANIEKVKGELAAYELNPEDWGGDIPMIPVSAHTGQGIPDLIDTILLISEDMNLKADPIRPAVGTVVESVLDKELGPTATILVNTGTLKQGSAFVIGETYGRVKMMKDFLGKKVDIATPSTPVRLSGIHDVPVVGDILQVFPDEKEARKRASDVKALRESKRLRDGIGMDLATMMSKIQSGELKNLKIVLKADTKGSLEAIRGSIAKIKSDKVSVKIIFSGVGNITPTDVLMASASGALVVGFHVANAPQVEETSRRENVEVRHYSIIYKILEDLENILIGLLDPEVVEVQLGEADIIEIFFTKKGKDSIIGLMVKKGKLENNCSVRIEHEGSIIGEGTISSLQRNKENVNEVKEGYECGIKLKSKIVPEKGDRFLAYKVEKRKQTSL